MGCDIHVIIEYKRNDSYWALFAKDLNVDRHYGIFAALAGVRNYWDLNPVAANRGVPDDCSMVTFHYHTCLIHDQFAKDDKDGEFVRNADAERWVQQGISEFVETKIGSPRVTDPDLHSKSWATADELEQAINLVKDYCAKNGLDIDYNSFVEYEAILSVLRGLNRSGHPEARMVFMFDN